MLYQQHIEEGKQVYYEKCIDKNLGRNRNYKYSFVTLPSKWQNNDELDFGNTKCERQHVHRHEYCGLYSHGAFPACVCFKSDFLSKRKHDKTIFRVGYRLNDNYPYQPDDVLTQTLRFTVEKCLLFFPTPYIIQYRLY